MSKNSILYNITSERCYMEVTFMEPQEYSYCCEAKKRCKRPNCLCIIAVILGVLFAGIIGVIIGAEIATAVLEALAAVIVLAITFGVLFILTIILLLCKKHKDC